MSAPVLSAEHQFEWHRKPTGWSGAPCPVCGCQAKRLRAEHRALRFPENIEYGGPYIKRVKVCFGLDSRREVIR